jgi:hypothetical protein
MGREAYLDMRDRKLGGIREKELHDKQLHYMQAHSSSNRHYQDTRITKREKKMHAFRQKTQKKQTVWCRCKSNINMSLSEIVV